MFQLLLLSTPTAIHLCPLVLALLPYELHLLTHTGKDLQGTAYLTVESEIHQQFGINWLIVS